MKYYQYKRLEIVCTIGNSEEWIEKLNRRLATDDFIGYKVHSITEQGYGGDKYWKYFLLEKEMK